MPLPNPSLDDKSFNEIFEEAKKRIALYTSVWTDYNPSDPGITLLELFSWLAETQLYSLNRVTQKNQLKYLKLLGIKPRGPIPTKIAVTFTTGKDGFLVPKGTRLKPKLENGSNFETDEDINFETDEDVNVTSAKINKILVYSQYEYEDVTSVEQSGGTFYAFGENPKPGNSFYVGIKIDKDHNDKLLIPKYPVKLLVHLSEEDIDLFPIGVHFEEKQSIQVSSKLIWECSTDDKEIGWLRLESQDETAALTKSGMIRLTIPEKIASVVIDKFSQADYSLCWLRCRIVSGQYEIPPKISAIKINAIYVTQGLTNADTEEKEVFTSNGLPNQSFTIQNNPIIEFHELQEIIDSKPEKLWQEVDDLDASGPEDNHFSIDTINGVIFFGDGISGKIPPKDSKFKIKYRFSNTDEVPVLGSATKFAITNNKNKPIPKEDITVTHFWQSGGMKRESIDDAIVRARQELKIPSKAVSTDDFEYIAKQTPGLRVARAFAFNSPETNNTVTVIVVPYSPLKNPIPSDVFLHNVCQHLDKHRLITTNLHVVGPNYVRISVNAVIKIRPKYDPKLIEGRVIDILDTFFAPFPREKGQKGWPFGRTVYRSEVYKVIQDVEGIDRVQTLTLSASAEKSETFENKLGNIWINDLSLVYSGDHVIRILPTDSECEIHPQHENIGVGNS